MRTIYMKLYMYTQEKQLPIIVQISLQITLALRVSAILIYSPFLTALKLMLPAVDVRS